MKRLFSLLAALSVFCPIAWGQSITILPGADFRDAQWGIYGALESVTDDAGGVLTFFVRNNDALPDSITSVVVTAHSTTHAGEGMRIWPRTMAGAGGIATVQIKGDTFPFREGDTLNLAVTTARGATHTLTSWVNRTPQLHLANAIPAAGMKSIFLYLRNEEASACDVQQVWINDRGYLPTDPEITSLSGSFSLDSNGLLILEIESGSTFVQNEPLAIRLQYLRVSDGSLHWTSDGIRVVQPEFPIGSWHSSGLNPDKEYGRKLLRHLSLTSLHGPGDPGLMAIGESEYFIRTLWEPYFGSGSLPDSSVVRPIVQAHDAGDYVAAWNVDDEPDINGKPLAHELIRNQTYWEHGLTKPSYVNLASQKHFNRFGWFTDIVAMDHYSAPAPPNIIPNTWIPTVGRVGELQEAGEYTWMLKVNSEPRRMHAWCQLAAGVWYQQPTPETVNYQFWSHILHGAKGIEFFTAQSDSPVEYPALWSEAEQLSEQLAEMRTACLYGEPVPTATDVVSGDVEAHLLAGPDAAVLGVLNGSFSFAFNASTLRWDASYTPQSYQVEVTLPAWLSPVQFWYITAGSRLNASSWFTSLGANRYRLAPPINLDGDSHVFLLLNAVDTEVPLAPTGANIPEYIDLANYTLSWSEPHDNVGVSNYRLSWNGSLVDVVAWPVYDVVDGDHNCVTGSWSIEAVDWAGNIGSATFVPITISIGTPSLTSPPADASVSDGGTMQFGVSATGDGLHYAWEVSTNGGISWAPVPMAAPYSGTDTDTLTLSPAGLALDSNLYRCIVSNPCGDVVTSADALLEVTPLMAVSPSSWRVELHPNPASEAIHLQVSGDVQLSTLRIIDLMGRTCLGPLAAEGQMVDLPVGGLPQGGYLLEIVLGDGSVMFERFCVVR